ncbi:MAG: ubiquinone/menaquinone biosynthesis methyltransferase [Actinobacteria bacterium]|nr:ubiquinone/menaquinone biosynthesis methyltransferase [Actinomycetota bacterium]
MTRDPAPDLPAPEEKAATVQRMFDRVAARYDLLNRLLTFGMDVGWRRRAVRELGLPNGSTVLDLACGTGDLMDEARRAGHRAFGFDFSAGMLGAAHSRRALVRADVMAIPVRTGAADGVTCGFALRNVVDLDALFAESARVLRAGGRAAFLETAEPPGRVMRAGHGFYFNRVVPFVGGLVSDRAAYRYLPASMAYLPPGDRLVEMLRAAGFSDAGRVALAGGIAQLLVGTRA